MSRPINDVLIETGSRKVVRSLAGNIGGPTIKLIIGNKRYSSWSLRPWLLMRYFDIPFEEQLIPLDLPETSHEIFKLSPTGKVPVLIDGKTTIWESLAIAEYLNEKYPLLFMWPKDTSDRASARSIAHEMHAGFQTMRSRMPHDLQKSLKGFDWLPAKADVQRIFTIWTDCLKKSGGPYLYDSFSIADAMYAPVVNRLVSYDVPCEGLILKYVEAIRTLPAHTGMDLCWRRRETPRPLALKVTERLIMCFESGHFELSF